MTKNIYTVIKISGGLGNQLFQYLFGIANFSADNSKLIFDISDYFNANNPRKFVLDKLGLSGNYAVSKSESYYLDGLEYICLENIEWKVSHPSFDLPKQIECRVFREEQFNHASPPRGENAYYWGYWQTPAAWPKEEFVLPQVYEQICNSSLMERVNQLLQSSLPIDAETCAIHVRGEDYLALIDYHGICSAAYFESSITKYPGCKFHIYTNDVEYAKRVLPKDRDYLFINNLVEDDLLEFLLLTKYSNYIISNSSYSYLAASIAGIRNASIRVVAPYPWFSFIREGPKFGTAWQSINRTTGNTYEQDLALIENIKISVIIPVHKRVEYLEETLNSVLSQTRLPNEIIFSQNVASAPVKDEVARLSKLSSLIRVVDSDSPSLSLARNRGIQSAQGGLLAFLDDDDIWVANKLEMQVKNLILMGASAISGNFYEFNDQGVVFNKSEYSLPGGKTWVQLLGSQNYFSGGSAAMVRAEVFKRVGYFDESLPTCEDHDMWFRMACARESFVFIDEVLTGIRKNGKNMSSDKSGMLRGRLILFSKMLKNKDLDQQIIKDFYLQLVEDANLIFFPKTEEIFIKYPSGLYEATLTCWHLRVIKRFFELKVNPKLRSIKQRAFFNLKYKTKSKPKLILFIFFRLLKFIFVTLICIPIELIIFFFKKIRRH